MGAYPVVLGSYLADYGLRLVKDIEDILAGSIGLQNGRCWRDPVVGKRQQVNRKRMYGRLQVRKGQWWEEGPERRHRGQ